MSDAALAAKTQQAIRNEDDFECMSVPVKYREMGTFYKAGAPPRSSSLPG